MAEETAQDFLEFSPYYDKKTMPNNLFKPKDPFTHDPVNEEDRR
jgi:hypothetical protein